MSVRTMARVWEASRHGGTELLMLLAIADFSDDDGNAYPAVPTLAKKCRTTPRHANRLLGALREGGELEIRVNEGPKGTNRYRIMFGGMTHASPLPCKSPLTGGSSLTSKSETPDAQVLKPLTPKSDEPSLNHQEPSSMSLTRPAPKLPKCPYDLVVECYHDVLPKWPRVHSLDVDGRKGVISKFWTFALTSTKADGSRRATNTDEALAFVRRYLERATHNDFLMGRSGRCAGHENWKPDIDFVLSDKGRRQVLEKTDVATA